MSPSNDTFARQALERHQRRREEQRIPTLTTLVGPPGHAMGLLRRWLEARHRPLCAVVSPTEAEAVQSWFGALARARKLRADAADFLGTSAGLAPGEARARLEAKTSYERDVFLQELLPTAPSGDATAVCRVLLESSVPQEPEALFQRVLSACGGQPLRAFTALQALVPPGTAPALVLAGLGLGWLARAARTAARLCAAAPTLPLALNADKPAVDTFLSSGETQPHAMLREGLIALEAPSPEALRQRLEALGVQRTGPLSASLSRLAADGASEELLTRFSQAARDGEAATDDPAEDDRARSAAERFLHLMLEESPETQGLFELNGQAEFRIHNRPVEVDFLSRRLRLAIEIDGYYHFRDAEAYRRDRRKDLELQRHGYLVIRFLAIDVVERLPEIRDTIQQVVAQRRDPI